MGQHQPRNEESGNTPWTGGAMPPSANNHQTRPDSLNPEQQQLQQQLLYSLAKAQGLNIDGKANPIEHLQTMFQRQIQVAIIGILLLKVVFFLIIAHLYCLTFR